MFTIENEYLSVAAVSKGAELSSLYNKEKQRECMWRGDPAWWGKKSPVLFPIVGALKDNTYYFNGQAYQLGRHGFARDREFIPQENSTTSMTFLLESDASTLRVFPFPFRLSISYQLHEKRLSVQYRVTNTGSADMYFSIGGHPAFAVPFSPGDSYNNYVLLFDEAEEAGRWPITPEGLLKANPEPLLNNNNILPLTKQLFYNDAVVFKNLRSGSVAIIAKHAPEKLTVDFTGFPYLGIWTAHDADFVCIEPWCGIADSIATNQQLTEKEGINCLAARDTFKRSWSVTID
ncbi:MAG TPA: aldose 1-epimerase family protein [Chitinophagaceae bacterium]|nr:aldose 1-epimerase family protein [Chitinophagaceae bacterium]